MEAENVKTYPAPACPRRRYRWDLYVSRRPLGGASRQEWKFRVIEGAHLTHTNVSCVGNVEMAVRHVMFRLKEYGRLAVFVAPNGDVFIEPLGQQQDPDINVAQAAWMAGVFARGCPQEILQEAMLYTYVQQNPSAAKTYGF